MICCVSYCSVRVVLAVCKSYVVISGLGLFRSCPEKQDILCEQLAPSTGANEPAL